MQQSGFFARVINSVGQFCHVVVKSCYDMEWYRLVRVRPWTSALRYAIGFHLALTVFAVAAFAPGLFALQAGFIAHVGARVPGDAKLEVKGGRLSTNLAEPFEAGTKDFRVVIDTSVQGTNVFPEAISKVDGVLIGKDAIFLQNDKSERRTYLMTDFSEFSVTRDEVMEWVRMWGAALILAALGMFAVAFWLLSLASTALYVAIASAIASGIGRLWGVRLSFASWFAVGLYAVTLPILANLAITAIGSRIPFAYTLIYFMFVAAVIADERNQPTDKPAALSEEPQVRGGGASQEGPRSPQGPTPPPASSRGTGMKPPKTRKIAKRRPPADKPPVESEE